MHFSASSCCSFSARRDSPSVALGGLLRQLTVKFGNLCAARIDIIGKLKPGAFQSPICFSRELEIFAQFSRFTFEYRCLFFDLVEFLAQRLIGCARFRQHSRQTHRLGFFLFKSAEGAVERRNQLVESLLEVVELADFSAGISQQIAQDLVFLTHPRTDVGQAFHRDMVAAVAISVCSSRQKFVDLGRAALSAKKVRQLRHDDASPTPETLRQPQTPQLRYYIAVAMETLATAACAFRRVRPALVGHGCKGCACM